VAVARHVVMLLVRLEDSGAAEVIVYLRAQVHLRAEEIFRPAEVLETCDWHLSVAVESHRYGPVWPFQALLV